MSEQESKESGRRDRNVLVALAVIMKDLFVLVIILVALSAPGWYPTLQRELQDRKLLECLETGEDHKTCRELFPEIKERPSGC